MTYTNPPLDMSGEPVKLGDRIVGAFRTANRTVPELRLGTIIGFGSRKDRYTKIPEDTLRVTWDTGSYAAEIAELSRRKRIQNVRTPKMSTYTSSILVKHKRFLKIK